MKRILLALLVLVASFIAFQQVRGCVVSEETKIRWRIEAMQEGFNEAKVAPCLRGVAEGWRDSQGRVDRALLADALRYAFLQERDPKTKSFRYRVDFEEELFIELDPEDEDRALAVLVLRFDRIDGEEWSVTWRVRVQATMARSEDRGWQIARTERETIWSDGRLMRRR